MSNFIWYFLLNLFVDKFSAKFYIQQKLYSIKFVYLICSTYLVLYHHIIADKIHGFNVDLIFCHNMLSCWIAKLTMLKGLYVHIVKQKCCYPSSRSAESSVDKFSTQFIFSKFSIRTAFSTIIVLKIYCTINVYCRKVTISMYFYWHTASRN